MSNGTSSYLNHSYGTFCLTYQCSDVGDLEVQALCDGPDRQDESFVRVAILTENFLSCLCVMLFSDDRDMSTQ